MRRSELSTTSDPCSAKQLHSTHDLYQTFHKGFNRQFYSVIRQSVHNSRVSPKIGWFGKPKATNYIKLILISHLLFWCFSLMEPRGDADQGSGMSKPNYALMTDAEREAEFRRQHQEYIAEKIARKKEMLRLRRANLSSSSSDDSDDDGSGGASSSSGSSVQRRKKQIQKQPPQLKPIKSSSKKNEEPAESLKFSILSLKKGGEWVKDLLEFQGDTLTVLNIPYDIKTFNKVKLVSENIQGNPFKIKISIQKSELLFSPILATKTDEHGGLPTNYFIFAKIVQEKLIQSGLKLRESKQEKISGVPESLINNCQIYGKLLKKSQVLGNWEERFMVINKDGLFSYKKFNEKYTMHFARGSIKEIWTRFYIHDEMLVVKVMQNSKKIEFGFPLTQVLCAHCWLHSLFGLMCKK